MATTPANNTVAGLGSQLQQGLAALNNLGFNLNGAAGGGGTGAAPQAGAQANNGTTPAAGTTGNPSGTGAPPMQVPGTGKPQILQIGGQTKYFAAAPVGQMATEITAFQYTESHQFKINLDYREGIATGLANLSRIFGARQERVRLLSNALANDANNTGAFNPVDLQKMSLETTTTQQLSEMQKKIFDSMRDSIQAWLR